MVYLHLCSRYSTYLTVHVSHLMSQRSVLELLGHCVTFVLCFVSHQHRVFTLNEWIECVGCMLDKCVCVWYSHAMCVFGTQHATEVVPIVFVCWKVRVFVITSSFCTPWLRTGHARRERGQVRCVHGSPPPHLSTGLTPPHLWVV